MKKELSTSTSKGMSRALWFIACLLAPMLFIACAEENGSGSAGTPPPVHCMNGTVNCDSSVYGQHQGYSPYPQSPYYSNTSENAADAYKGFNFSNLCDCPQGQRPVYNGIIGLGCVNASAVRNIGNALHWSYQARNGQFVNTPQISNTQGYAGNTTSCYKDVVQSCLVDQPNSCGTGSFCRATAGASRLGICTSPKPIPASSPRGNWMTGTVGSGAGAGTGSHTSTGNAGYR